MENNEVIESVVINQDESIVVDDINLDGFWKAWQQYIVNLSYFGALD